MNLAIFLPNWIGDVVMATPAVRALRLQYPQGRMIAVARPYIAGVLEGSSWFDEILFLERKGPWNRRWAAVAWQLRARSVDLAVLFPNSFRAALAAWLGGCRRRIGYNRYARGWLLTDRLEPLRDGQGKIVPTPIIDDYNRLAVTAACPPPGHRMELFTTAADERAAAAVWDNAGFDHLDEVVCLNPGAAFGAAKHWPADHFALLAKDLADRRGCGILVLCGPGERDMARNIARLANRPRVHALADDPLSLGLTKALIRRCSLLVTTDSGPRHFAAAFGRPVVTLFGPTHIAWTETFYPLAIHLQKKVECGPCQQRVCPLDHRCMQQLRPGEVYQAACRLLAGQRRETKRAVGAEERKVS